MNIHAYMNNVVSQRFIKCVNKLKESGIIPSYRQFSISLDYQPQNFHEIVNGKRDVTIELLRRAVETYQFNAEYIFSGKGSLFNNQGDENGFRILTIVTDQFNEEKIVHVPVPAQAGYTSGLANSEFYGDLPTYSLPDYRFKAGTHRSFDVAGDSMEPTLQEGDKVICSYVEPNYWINSIRDNHVYVVVTHGDILVKRIKNQITEKGLIQLISDNSFYEPYEVEINEIKELWYVQCKISSFTHCPVNGPIDLQLPKNDELNHLKNVIGEQTRLISKLNTTIERLLNSTIAL